MYQSLHIPSTHSSSHQYGQGIQDNTDEGEYETDELSSMPYQPPSLPLSVTKVMFHTLSRLHGD